MGTTTQYQPRDFRRVCDQCGVLWQRSQLHRKGPWIYCWDCDQPGDRIREQEDAAIARMRPFRILPVPNAKPQNIHAPYDWLTEEAQVFNLVALQALPSLSSGPQNSAWAAIYLGQLLQQGTRPQLWLTLAQQQFRAQLDNLLTGQYGSPTGPAASVTDMRYGGISNGVSCSTNWTIAAGIGFVLGYTVLGDVKYIVAADRVATFLRHAQCMDLLVSGYTVFPAGGGRYHVGGVSSGVAVGGPSYNSTFLTSDIIALWFLSDLAAIRGQSASYGDTSPNSTFSAATAAPISQMIAELTTFAVTGPMDAGAGTTVSGLSTAKPQASYAPAINGVGGAAAWTFASTIASSVIAQAIAGLYKSVGVTATVTGLLAWLAAFTANPTNATPSTNSVQQTLDGITGTYDPTIAPATSLTAGAPFTEATGALYDLASLGILAPVLAATGAAGLRASRSTVSQAYPYSTFYLDGRYPGPLGRLGLSLQPHSAANQTVKSALLAAQFGAVYRVVNP